jgi:hypothetical protein
MTSMVSLIRTYKAVAWDMFLSAFGCFILRRCFRLVAEGRGGPETGATVVAIGHARDPVAYMGAALILLALAANEPPALMHARRI